ncbi:MAG: bifunctional folylpolyglutamate synthase/dihydrofolate synthase [Candidatus Aminicenantes bacterium]|nr:bifunctional folylpolyglutamate synthase/dihydrofolate synthase [Candidatus Aminicenantes bacterium]
MNYEQCLAYLDSIQNLGIKFGLDNVRAILLALGNPHLEYPSLLVAGSNGKGSVCAMLARILELHGYRTGLYTSPHLIDLRERIRLNGRMVSRQCFCRNLTALKDCIDELIAKKILISVPTYFEMMTCLAFLCFKERKVNMAVLEVGMGGRFDATNVVTPLVSVITTISGEHKKYLGDTLARIAFEKAGIIKPDVHVVCGVRHGEAYDVIKKRAEELKAPFFGVFNGKRRLETMKRGGKFAFTYRSDSREYSFCPSLRGEHQGRNAAIAVAAAEVLSGIHEKIPSETVVRGVESTLWEGRLEVYSQNPLVLLDGAHNEEGALALRNYIREFVSPPVILIFAVMRDKEIDLLADILFPLAKKVFLTSFPYFRAASPREIKGRTKFHEKIVLEPVVRRAVQRALHEAGPDGSVVVAGSLFLVGEVKRIWGQVFA